MGHYGCESRAVWAVVNCLLRNGGSSGLGWLRVLRLDGAGGPGPRKIPRVGDKNPGADVFVNSL